ncbi:MAG: hypothetical protein CMP65_05620 [Flavobacteriales bacterium]|nr:hypothetical protein [Flavobacteriales bacterium]|tara:strand:+ start:3852 stop:4322 length:471 start_codon:yes stop_codon:yes gene_type:complete
MSNYQFLFLISIFFYSCTKTNISTPICIIGDIYISEAHTSGYPEDYIEIFNSTDKDCRLSNFLLDDSPLFEDFLFSDIIIKANDFWIGYEDFDNSFSSGLSSKGDMIYFSDGDTIIQYNLGPSISDFSQSFDKSGDRCYTIPTPGYSNAGCVNLSL